MKEIGNFLREKREELSLSLSEVEKEIKIRKKYLQALEEGNFDIIPGKAYVLGYTKNYAKFLHISEEDINSIINTYKDYLKKEKIILEDKKEVPVLVKKKEKLPALKKRKSTLVFLSRYFYLISFAVIILVGLFWINHSLRKAENIPIPSPEIKTETEVNIVESEDIEYKELTTIDQNLIEDRLAEEILYEKNFPILKIVANNNTWVKILSSNETIFEGILLKGEEISWQKESELNLITEYPPQVEVFYNDEKIEIKEGVIKNKVLNYNFSSI